MKKILILSMIILFMTNCKKADNNSTSTSNPIPGPTVRDADGNEYHSVLIGNQVWMLENLKTTKYNDSTSIPLSTNHYNLIGSYTFPEKDSSNKDTYGLLYNLFAVTFGKLAPIGWRIPTNGDWIELETFLKGENVAGGKMKEKGLTHWNPPNTGASNNSGFSALPAGAGYQLGTLGYFATFWSSSLTNDGYGYGRSVLSTQEGVYTYSPESATSFYSVRCIKN